jgi:Mg2+ and Co2+ transporter CorA
MSETSTYYCKESSEGNTSRSSEDFKALQFDPEVDTNRIQIVNTKRKMENGDEESGVPPRPTLQRDDQPPVAGMKLSVYKIDKNGNFVPAELEEAIARRASGSTNAVALPPDSGSSLDGTTGSATSTTASQDSFWIDADVRDDYDAQELYEIIQKIRLTPFLRRHLSKPSQIKTPQVLSLNSSVFLVMRVLPPEEDKSNEMRYVAALSVRGLLLTVTTCPKDGQAAHAGRLLNQSTRKSVQQRELPEPTTSGALCMWLLSHVQRVNTVAQRLRKQCFELDERMDHGIGEVGLEDIVDLKNDVIKIIAVSEEQLECLESLKEGETMTTGLDFSKLRGSMGICMATAGFNERMAGRLEKKVADLRTTYDSHQQNLINKRLEMLTILSAIFLPLTLMAGTSILYMSKRD